MSSEIQFSDKLLLSKSSTNQKVYFDIDSTTGLLVVANSVSGTGGFRVNGAEVDINCPVDISSTLTVGTRVTSPIAKLQSVEVLNASLPIVLFGNVEVRGDLKVIGENSSVTPGEVLVSDPVLVVNTEDPGPGMTTAYAGFRVQRGVPVGQQTPGGIAGQGSNPHVGIVWDEFNQVWDLNSGIGDPNVDQLPAHPRITHVGYPLGATDVSTKGYVDDEILELKNEGMSLDNLSDVTISGTLSNNRMLKFNTATSQWSPSPCTITNLDNVAPTAVPSGILKWNSAGTQVTFVSTIPHTQITGLSEVAIAGTSLVGNLEDVSINASLATGNVLRYAAAQWENAVLSFNDLSDTPTNNSYSLVGLNDTSNITPTGSSILVWNSEASEVIYVDTIPANQVDGLAPVAYQGSSILDNLENVSISSDPAATDGEVLRYNGSVWENSVLSFNDLSDTPTNNSYSLVGLNDTADTAVANGILKWNATGTQVSFVSSIPASQVTGLSAVAVTGQGSLDYLTDVSIASPATNQVVKYNGTTWVNSVLQFTDISGTPTNSSYSLIGLSDTASSATPLALLKWNATGTQVDYVSDIPASQVTGLSAVAVTGQGSLDYLTDVSIASPATNQVVKYNGTTWVNSVLQFSEVSGTPTNNSYSLVGLSDTADGSPATRANGYLRWSADGSQVIYQASIVADQALIANKLTTARQISISGLATGSVSFDGSANVTIPLTLVADSVTLGTHTTGNFVGGLTAGTGIASIPATGEGTVHTIAVDSTVARTSVSETFDQNLSVLGTFSVSSTATAPTPTAGTNNTQIATTAFVTTAISSKANLASPVFTGTVTTPALLVTNTTNSTSAITGSLQTRGGLGVGADAYIAGDMLAFSDARLKTDVETIANALDTVRKSRGVRYRRIDTGEVQIGVIAQELQQVLPEVVKGDETLAVAYGNIVGLLIEAIKELSEEVNDLKTQLNKRA